MNLIRDFLPLTKLIQLSALDIGARKGVSKDLISIAPSIDFYGFEPDRIECEKLNNSKNLIWNSITYIPTALSHNNSSIDLNLYRQRGCSSKLKVDNDIAEMFSRSEYYIKDGTVKVPCKKLDDVVDEFSIETPAFMKIDVQGMEVDVFKGSIKTLENSLVAIRTEVNFLPIYNDLPLYSDIDKTLRPYGFLPFCFLEMHEWRRYTKKKLPKLGPEPFPYSKGQMIHGDVLYMLTPEYFTLKSDDQIRREIRLAIIALCYDRLDHAAEIFKKSYIKEFCNDFSLTDPILTLQKISRSKAQNYKGIMRIIRKIVKKFDL